MPITQIVFHGDIDDKIAEVVADNIIISKVQDALDLMVNQALQGTRKIILHQPSISPDFFELRTGLAGEILQKFVNYGVQLAIVGDFKDITSKSLNDFITECNRGTSFFFLDSVEDAVKNLSS
ncbi:MAG: DUF4180 domain-containing protein [Patescibacteria group bacterium]|nr:DUF4180 domain-containing protein [Patescibacteria group bacterium]